jgi:hypothetical protein
VVTTITPITMETTTTPITRQMPGTTTTATKAVGTITGT